MAKQQETAVSEEFALLETIGAVKQIKNAVETLAKIKKGELGLEDVITNDGKLYEVDKGQVMLTIETLQRLVGLPKSSAAKKSAGTGGKMSPAEKTAYNNYVARLTAGEKLNTQDLADLKAIAEKRERNKPVVKKALGLK